ncbi:MAG: rRNA maturation RNase YbeY [Bacteroidales bacterium]|jgi:rRNA maturation RNase YbeY|nr:rRNA maturation RNase YbeY [Bacteroidales bacterium]
MAISFTINSNFILPYQRTHLKRWIKQVVADYDKQIDDVAFIFCDDDDLLEINNKYLNHDFYTDIITFDYCENNIINGDIFISVQRVKDNAQKLKIPFEEELKRVIIHGILHLCGLKDKTKQQSVTMRAAEDKAITFF